MAYCDDCLFYRLENLDSGVEPYCKAHANLTVPIFEAEEKQKCFFHLTVEVAKLQASVRNAAFDSLGDPVEFAEKLKDRLFSSDMQACIDKNIKEVE